MQSARLLPALLLLCCLCSGCDKEEAAPSRAALLGSWQWKSSFCGWSGASSPATTGYTEVLLLDFSGRAQLYRNGTLQSNTAYTLSRHYSALSQETADYINFDNRELRYRIQNNTLTLSEETADGCSSSYERLNQ